MTVWPSRYPRSRMLSKNAVLGASLAEPAARTPTRGIFPNCCASLASGVTRSSKATIEERLTFGLTAALVQRAVHGVAHDWGSQLLSPRYYTPWSAQRPASTARAVLARVRL